MKESSRMPLFDLKKLNTSLPVPSVPKSSIKVLVLGAKNDFIVVMIILLLIYFIHFSLTIDSFPSNPVAKSAMCHNNFPYNFFSKDKNHFKFIQIHISKHIIACLFQV